MFILSGWSAKTGLLYSRVSYRGGGGALEFPPPPPPPEILKLSKVIIVLSQILNNNLVSDCARSNLRVFEFKIFLVEHALVGTHTYAYVSVFLHATIILLPSCSPPPPPPPPNSKSCMKPGLGYTIARQNNSNWFNQQAFPCKKGSLGTS